ncbi:MAG: hypothetical protein LBU85_09440 [Treponema sp.]|nr:hypothetical protein [Treponema sp.]
MSNFRWGGIAGVAALVLSFGIGVLSGVNIFHVILRALIFTVVFFGIGTGIWILINHNIPDLIASNDDNKEGDDTMRPGSRVNVTLDSNEGFAMPEMYRNSGNPDEVGNIGDLFSGAFRPASAKKETPFGGMDLGGEDNYTYEESGPGSQNPESSGFQDTPHNSGAGPAPAPAFTPSFGDDSADWGGLPELDAMAGSFLSGGTEEPVPDVVGPKTGPERDPRGNKSQPLKGDFDPKELAQGIRTVLSKEK